MIELTRLNSTKLHLNPDLIERMEAAPDTVIMLVNGTTYVCSETVTEVVNAIISYRSAISVAAFNSVDTPDLRLVSADNVGEI